MRFLGHFIILLFALTLVTGQASAFALQSGWQDGEKAMPQHHQDMAEHDCCDEEETAEAVENCCDNGCGQCLDLSLPVGAVTTSIHLTVIPPEPSLLTAVDLYLSPLACKENPPPIA